MRRCGRQHNVNHARRGLTHRRFGVDHEELGFRVLRNHELRRGRCDRDRVFEQRELDFERRVVRVLFEIVIRVFFVRFAGVVEDLDRIDRIERARIDQHRVPGGTRSVVFFDVILDELFVVRTAARRRECVIGLLGEVHEGLMTGSQTDLPPQQLPYFFECFDGARERTAARERQRTLQETLQPAGEQMTAADLGNVDDLDEQCRQRVGILVFAKPAPEHKHHRAQRSLRDVCDDVVADRAGGGWR